jgi:hypothetical protein
MIDQCERYVDPCRHTSFTGLYARDELFRSRFRGAFLVKEDVIV